MQTEKNSSANQRLRALYKLNPGLHPPLVLAPIAGYSSAPMRQLASYHGAELTFTEMTHARGLLLDNPQTWHTLVTLPDEAPVVAHLYGTIPDDLAEAAARVEATGRFAGIDLNAGCPVRKVTIHGAGAALLHNPDQIFAILKAMRQAVKLPLSLKTRPGPSPDKIRIFEILAAAQEAGVDMLTLHARFTSRGHGGPANLDLLAEVKEQATIPIIGNGGINAPHEAWRMWHESGVDGLMIARAALGNPWIFKDISTALSSSQEQPPIEITRPRRNLDDIRSTLADHLAAEEKHLRALHQTSTTSESDSIEQALVTIFRHHLFRYLHGLKGSSYLRGHLHTLKNCADIWHAVDNCIQREASWRSPKNT